MSIAPDFAPAALPVTPQGSGGVQTLADVRLTTERVRAWMRDNVMGRDDVIELVLVALFADGHVDSLRDSNMDGEFGWLDGSSIRGDDPYDDQDIERKVFGGHLTTGRFAPDPTRQRSVVDR